MALLKASVKTTKQSKIDYKQLSDHELVEVCKNLKGERGAWEEFFYRFIPVIKYSIQSQLIKNGYGQSCHNEDILGDIHEKIVISLYSEGILNQCIDSKGIRSWLRKVAVNKTIDWLKQQETVKRLPQKQSALLTKSFSEPVSNDSELTIEEIIGDTGSFYLIDIEDAIKNESEQDNNFRHLAGINEEQKYWIFRLSIIFDSPLSADEQKELSAFRGIALSLLEEELSNTTKSLEEKEEKRVEALGKAVLYWHEILKMEYQITQLSDNPDDNAQKKIQAVKAEIIKKQNQREKILNKELNRVCRPTHEEIARLSGFPENKADQVSDIINRIRKRLKSKGFLNSDILHNVSNLNGRK